MNGLSNYASKQDIPNVGVCLKEVETNDFDSILHGKIHLQYPKCKNKNFLSK